MDHPSLAPTWGKLVMRETWRVIQAANQPVSDTEFKEIRKEWKARKKEEDNQRKAEEERQRQAAQQAAQNGGPDPQGPDGTPTSSYPGSRPTLPPIGYQPTQYPPPSGGVPQQPLPEYPGHMYPSYPPPHSPYPQPHQNMYSQCKSIQAQDLEHGSMLKARR